MICYQPMKFSPAVRSVIDQANAILQEYAAQGYDLTLRQVYYQFVARGLIANQDREYKRLGDIINNARMAGLIDWDRITDRTRNLKANAHWDSPEAIVAACGEQYQIDKWGAQSNYVEVWVEKDALVGVLQVACQPLDVPYFSCRGYTSQSEMWAAGQRLLTKLRAGKKLTVIHLGDHDPSGIDMSRDIFDRLNVFLRYHIMVEFIRARPSCPKEERTDEWAQRESTQMCNETSYNEPLQLCRIALNMDQIEQYEPPPNPAKITDSRARGYIDRFGEESWELDALEPAVITNLIRQEVEELRNQEAWERAVAEEGEAQKDLQRVAQHWSKALKAASR